MKMCSVETCGRPHYAKGYCNLHWQRERKSGNPLVIKFGKAAKGAPTRWIEEHRNCSLEDCLIWPFARRENGYPKMGHASPARLMCEHSHGKPPSGDHKHVAHSCGNGHLGCLNPKHLRWATVSENHADKKLHGTHLCGEAIKQSKLTEAEVRKIRGEKDPSISDLVSFYKVSRATIIRIIAGHSWRHVQ